MSDTTNTTFSYKQELIQLHQVLAEARIFCKRKFNADVEIENLDEYKEIGVTSIELDAGIDDQLNAILALSNELADVLSAEENENEKMVATADTETVATTLFDVTENGIAADANKATVEQNQKEATTTDAETSAERDEPYGTSDEVEMINTSILASWSDVCDEKTVTSEEIETVNPGEWQYENDGIEQTAEQDAGVQETVNAY